MLRELLSVFKSDTLMQRAYQRSYDMLDLTQEMFLRSNEVLRKTEHTNVKYNINDEDIEVNKYQREVRKDVFNYLVMTGTDELASGLVLVSIVIDIERIGDYTKNIVQIAKNHKERLHGGIFENELVRIENAIEENFARTIKCFKKSDEKAGEELLKDYRWVNKLSDDVLMAYVRNEDKNISSGSAVAATLYVRSLKRINSHLRNVTTSVVNPFHRIGYDPKKKKGYNDID